MIIKQGPQTWENVHVTETAPLAALIFIDNSRPLGAPRPTGFDLLRQSATWSAQRMMRAVLTPVGGAPPRARLRRSPTPARRLRATIPFPGGPTSIDKQLESVESATLVAASVRVAAQYPALACGVVVGLAGFGGGAACRDRTLVLISTGLADPGGGAESEGSFCPSFQPYMARIGRDGCRADIRPSRRRFSSVSFVQPMVVDANCVQLELHR